MLAPHYALFRSLPRSRHLDLCVFGPPPADVSDSVVNLVALFYPSSIFLAPLLTSKGMLNDVKKAHAERLTHQVKVNTMVHQIILSGLHPVRRTEVNTVLLTHIPNLLPRPRQPNDPRVELLEIALQHYRGVARRVAGDEEREHGLPGKGRRVGIVENGFGNRVAAGRGGGDDVDDFGEFVELFGADVRAVREAEVYL